MRNSWTATSPSQADRLRSDRRQSRRLGSIRPVNLSVVHESRRSFRASQSNSSRFGSSTHRWPLLCCNCLSSRIGAVTVAAAAAASISLKSPRRIGSASPRRIGRPPTALGTENRRRLACRSAVEEALPSRASRGRGVRLSERTGAVPHPREVRRGGQAAGVPGLSVRAASGRPQAGAQPAFQLSVGRRQQGEAGERASPRSEADRGADRPARRESDSTTGPFAEGASRLE